MHELNKILQLSVKINKKLDNSSHKLFLVIKYKRAHTNMHMHARKQQCTCTHTRMHAHTHACTLHTHTHTHITSHHIEQTEAGF